MFPGRDHEDGGEFDQELGREGNQILASILKGDVRDLFVIDLASLKKV
jgi:hypothetical protein